jgi:WD40 repeat protein
VYRVDLKTHQRIAVTGSVLSEEPTGALSPDGRLVATSDRNGNLRLLDVDTLNWTGANSQVLAGSDVTFSPDGRQIAAVQADRFRLWDGRTGDYQASVALPTGLMGDVSIAYLPDSSGLLLSATDGRTWTVMTRFGTWVQRACRIAGRNLTKAEWRRFFPGRPYELTCPQWPAGT